MTKRFQPRQTVTLADLLGEAPLIVGEDAAAFTELHRRIKNSLLPQDAVEEFIVREIAVHIWEIERQRRYRAAYISSRLPDHLMSLMRPAFRSSDKREELGFQNVEELVAAWARGEAVAVERVDTLLKEIGVSIALIADAVPAQDPDRLGVMLLFDRQVLVLERRVEDDLDLLARYRDRRGSSPQRIGGGQRTIESQAEAPRTEEPAPGEAE